MKDSGLQKLLLLADNVIVQKTGTDRLSQKDEHRDQLLFRQIAAGNTGAFRQLFDLYLEPLRINAYKLLKNETWAEEIAQEVLAKVWEKRASLPEVERPAGWLYRVCTNECLMWIRKHGRELRSQYALQMAEAEHISEEQIPRYDLERLQQLVKDAVSLLTDQQRQVYLLQQEQELSYKEIAERLGISWHTVRNHLIKANECIRFHVREHGEFSLLLPAFLAFI